MDLLPLPCAECTISLLSYNSVFFCTNEKKKKTRLPSFKAGYILLKKKCALSWQCTCSTRSEFIGSPSLSLFSLTAFLFLVPARSYINQLKAVAPRHPLVQQLTTVEGAFTRVSASYATQIEA